MTRPEIEEFHRDVQVLPGVAASAVYRLNAGGPGMQAFAQRLQRLEHGAELGAATWVALTEFGSLDEALDAEAKIRGFPAESEDGRLRHHTRALYTTITDVPGNSRRDDLGFAPAVQFGTFDMDSVDAEWMLSDWYQHNRIPRFLGMPSGIRFRRFVSISGPAKYAVLYEFPSLDARMNEFEVPVEAHELDASSPSQPVLSRTVHLSASPGIGSLEFSV
ncbi:MAG: hypothetical protein GEV10_15695 [Streptosporangiales bacterium]|nr:hypothetical protein [Streptosporangiales bacterium]